MNMLPVHLKELSYNCVQKKNTITFYLKCHCSNETFKIMKAKTNYGKFEKERWENYWKRYKMPIFSFNSATDKKSGKQYLYGKTLFGFRIGRYYTDIISAPNDFCIVKVKCSHCEREFIVFDSRKHGYDALADVFDTQNLSRHSEVDNPNYESKSTLIFRNLCQEKQCAIKITVQNNLSRDEFFETFGNDVLETSYSEAFSHIAMYSIVDGQSKKIFDMETS